jgi:hypothetical protein
LGRAKVDMCNEVTLFFWTPMFEIRLYVENMIIILDSYKRFNEEDTNDRINEHENVNFVNKIHSYELQKFLEKWLQPRIGFVNLAMLIACFMYEEK